MSIISIIKSKISCGLRWAFVLNASRAWGSEFNVLLEDSSSLGFIILSNSFSICSDVKFPFFKASKVAGNIRAVLCGKLKLLLYDEVYPALLTFFIKSKNWVNVRFKSNDIGRAVSNSFVALSHNFKICKIWPNISSFVRFVLDFKVIIVDDNNYVLAGKLPPVSKRKLIIWSGRYPNSNNVSIWDCKTFKLLDISPGSNIISGCDGEASRILDMWP